MKLEELYDMIDKDMTIDRSELGNEALNNPKIYSKYLKLWSNESLKHEVMLNNIEALYQEKRKYYSGQADASTYKEKPFNERVKTEAGLTKYVNSDPDVIKAKEKIIVQEKKVQILEKTLYQIKDRGFSIKNAMDYFRFLEGY